MLWSNAEDQSDDTLDLDLQEYAQATLAAEVANLKGYRVSNGAALITKRLPAKFLQCRQH